MSGNFEGGTLLYRLKLILHSSTFYYVLSYFLILIIIVAKNPCLYIHPPFIVDDSMLFQYYFNHPDINDFFYFWGGYFSFFPNIFVKLFVLTLPLTWMPQAFALLSLLVKTTATWLFCLPPFSIFIPNRLVRLVISVLIAILPISHWTLDSGLMGYQHWNLLTIVFLVLVIEPCISDKTWCLVTLVVFMFICSTPVSIIFLPIFLVRAIQTLRNRKIVRSSTYFMLSACAVIYIFFGMVKLNMEVNPATQKQIIPDFQNIIQVGLCQSFQRVIFDSFLPPTFRMIAYGISPWLPLIMSVIIFIAICVVVIKVSRKNSPVANLAILVGYVALSITISVIMRKPVSDFFIYNEGGHRYFYAQRFLLLLLVFISVYQLTLLQTIRKKVLLTIIVFFVVTVFAVIENYRHHYTYTYQEYRNAVKFKKLDELQFARDLCNPGIKVEECLKKLSQMMNTAAKHNDKKGYVCCDEIEPPIRLKAYNEANKTPSPTTNR
jgi:hypothetical protein